MTARQAASLLPMLALSTFLATPAAALPTMIRLGYTNCAACHISPQGGGPLNVYGRGIDQAQSLRGGEYRPGEDEWVRAIDLGGRTTQDLRAVFQEQVTWVGDQGAARVFRPRLMYRNVTELGRGFRISATFTGGESAPRPSLRYDPAPGTPDGVVNTALLQYRVAKNVEIAAGVDQLPTGVNIPDLGTYIRAHNRLGYFDAPSQVKLYWWGKRHQIAPFAYAKGGYERPGEAETGVGALAEYDLLGHQRTIVGVSLLDGHATSGDRVTLGAYTRLGFGRWGILAEHDVTDRTRDTPTASASFRQQATYGQLFVALREWLVASAIAERLHVEDPFARHLAAGKLELAARLASQATVTIGTRVERDMRTGRLSKSVVVQAAVKTVH